MQQKEFKGLGRAVPRAVLYLNIRLGKQFKNTSYFLSLVFKVDESDSLEINPFSNSLLQATIFAKIVGTLAQS